MVKYRVLRRVDAFVDYVAEIDAETPTDAAYQAVLAQDQLRWSRVGSEEFAQALFVTLDSNGNELHDTIHM